MSWKSEVIADASDKWCSNQLRFATREEADSYAADLAMRWTAVQQWRVVYSDDPVKQRWLAGRAVDLEDVQ